MGNQPPAPVELLEAATAPAAGATPRPTTGDGFTTDDLTAAAFSAALERPVVTQGEYERRKHEPQFSQVETLDVKKIAELSFEPATGKFGDVYGESGDKITVWLTTLTGRMIDLKVGSDSYVEELKYLLEEHEGIPVDNDRLVLLFDKKQMSEGKRISEYGVVDESTIEFMPTLEASAPGIPLVLSDSVLNSQFDFDFTNITDDGAEYTRGGKCYKRPYGWKRIALNVQGKYENDTWLGLGGMRTDSSPGEWPVSYHGTKHEFADSIAMQGYMLSKGQRFMYGKGVYTSPSIEVAAGYATKFPYKDKQYRVVFQNRVSTEGMTAISPQRTGDDDEYWVQPDQSLIRPYGLCVQECIEH